MICPPCAKAADDPFVDHVHPAEICRDAAIQPHGCPCQHGRPRTAEDAATLNPSTKER